MTARSVKKSADPWGARKLTPREAQRSGDDVERKSARPAWSSASADLQICAVLPPIVVFTVLVAQSPTRQTVDRNLRIGSSGIEILVSALVVMSASAVALRLMYSASEREFAVRATVSDRR